MLQQRRDLIAERALLIGRVLELALIGIDATGQVNDAATAGEQGGRRRTHHAVQPNRSLATANHQQQRTITSRHPLRAGSWLEKVVPHRCTGDFRTATAQIISRLRQTKGHAGAKAAKQARDLAGDRIGFMQHHRTATEPCRQDRRGCDVATGGEDNSALLLANQACHRPGAPEQLNQLFELAQTSALQTTSPHGEQGIAARNQLAFQAIGNPHPADTPAVRHAISNRQGRKQMAASAAGCNQEPRHGRTRRGA